MAYFLRPQPQLQSMSGPSAAQYSKGRENLPSLDFLGQGAAINNWSPQLIVLGVSHLLVHLNLHTLSHEFLAGVLTETLCLKLRNKTRRNKKDNLLCTAETPLDHRNESVISINNPQSNNLQNEWIMQINAVLLSLRIDCPLT